jgi:hypothetical protein
MNIAQVRLETEKMQQAEQRDGLTDGHTGRRTDGQTDDG